MSLGEAWGCFPVAVGICLAFTGLGCSHRSERRTGAEDAPKAKRRKKNVVYRLGFLVDGASLVSQGRYSLS